MFQPLPMFRLLFNLAEMFLDSFLIFPYGSSSCCAILYLFLFLVNVCGPYQVPCGKLAGHKNGKGRKKKDKPRKRNERRRRRRRKSLPGQYPGQVAKLTDKRVSSVLLCSFYFLSLLQFFFLSLDSLDYIEQQPLGWGMKDGK